MNKYLASTVCNIEQKTLYQVEADSKEEALENFDEGEIISIDYEPKGYVVEVC